MSDQNSSRTSAPVTYLSNHSLSYTAIALLLSQDERLEKFGSVVATTNLSNIAAAVAHALENVLAVKPLIEVMKTSMGVVIFREDRKYVTVNAEGAEDFDPFNAEHAPDGEVRCKDTGERVIAKSSLRRVWKSLDYDFITNPILYLITAELLTAMLNENQEWAKLYYHNSAHSLRKYLSLQKVVDNYAPSLSNEYEALINELREYKKNFIMEVMANRPQSPPEVAIGAYEARGMDYVNRSMDEFWDRKEIGDALTHVFHTVQKIILNLFTTVRLADERNARPAYGYDVFLASVEANTQLVVKKVGDYRILHWELHK